MTSELLVLEQETEYSFG